MTSKARQLSHLLSVVLIGGLSTVVACSSGGGGDSTGGSSTGGSATGGKTGGSGGTGGTATGGSSVTGGKGGGTATGGTATGGGSVTGGKGGGTATGGTATGGGSVTGGSGGGAATGGSGPGGSSGCTNTDKSVLNLDASGYVCNNNWGIKGAWFCYSDGSDSTTSCKGSDGKGAGAIPWTPASNAMCMKGKMGSGDKYAGMGFNFNSAMPGSNDTPGTWNGSAIVGFAITLAPGASGLGSGGSVLYLEYPTTENLDPQTKDAPGVTVPGVGNSPITYNVLFADSVHANNIKKLPKVDPTKLVALKLALPKDAIEHSYDFCIKSIVPLTTAPTPVVASGVYGPTWNNQLAQTVNGVNGYAVQTAPFLDSGRDSTMQVNATSGGVGFVYKANFNSPNDTPGAFPAVVSGFGPGHAGVQFYGPYKGGKKVSELQSLKSSWSFTMGSGASGDAAYDVWFSNSTADPPIPAIELMVWIGNTGKNPIGSPTGKTFQGKTVYTGSNPTGEAVISYWVGSPGATSVPADFDLLPYFNDAVANNLKGMTNNSILLGVQTGFEVYGGTWTTTDYSINIQTK